MKKLEIALRLIDPPHKSFDCNKVKTLRESLKKGWSGRRLLVEELEPIGELSTTYAAWTGSHRIAALKKLGLKSVCVPCLVITLKEAKAARMHDDYKRKRGYSSLKRTISGHDGRGDRNKLDALVKVGLSDAAELMRTEIVENELNR